LKYLNILIKYLYNSEKIILHGLFISQINIILFLQPWLLKKSYWVIWGGDLYYYKFRKKSFKSDLYEFVRKKVIKNMGNIVCYNQSEFNLAKKWYGTKAKPFFTFFYPSNLFKNFDFENIEKEKFTYIQVGNSADPTNNHVEILEKLSEFKDKKIKIICPLSYGNIEYRKKVIEKGKEIFSNNFVPLTDFIPFEEYMKLLNKIDIAIFNHKRQQAVGNITSLLGFGKKVYIRDDITTWDLFNDIGIKIFPSNREKEFWIKKLDEETKEKNIKLVKEHFSKNQLIRDWEEIFKS
jgi:hypothetical protein